MSAVPLSSSHRWAALPVVLSGTFMVVLDFFIVNVAMPAIQADLGASAGAIEWVVAGYGLALAAFLITGGRLGDRFGRRRMFAVGMGLFTAASLGCGLATSPEMLVFWRLEQGLASALIMPQVLSIIGATYAGDERVRALSVYGAVMGLAAVGGQILGGALVSLDVFGLGWRSCFLINVPIGLAALALIRVVPESRGERTPLDLRGTALVTGGLVALVLPLVEGRAHGWPLWTWLSLALAPVLLGAFAVQQRRSAAPFVPLSLWRERSFTAGLITQLVFWAGQASFFLVLALYLQQGRGLSALEAGLVFTILAVAYLATSAPAPALTAQHGRRVALTGAFLLVDGHVALAIGVGGSVLALVPGLLLVGAGMGLVITPLMATVLESVGPAHAGAASSALSTVQQVGNAIGVAVTGVLFFGALDDGFDAAYALCAVQLAGLAAAVALMTRLLPRTAPDAAGVAAPA